MKKIATLFLLFILNVISPVSMGQGQISSNLKVSFSSCFLGSSWENINGLGVGYSAQFKSKIALGTELNLTWGKTIFANSNQILNCNNSFFMDYRPFDKWKISPKIHLESGYQMLSNAKNKYVDSHFGWHQTDQNTDIIILGKYKRFGPYFNLALNGSLRLKKLEFDLGIGYMINRLHVQSGEVDQIHSYNGLCLNSAIFFRLDFIYPKKLNGKENYFLNIFNLV